MALAQKKISTEEDYYNIPKDVRAELIDGQIYYHVKPEPDTPDYIWRIAYNNKQLYSIQKRELPGLRGPICSKTF